MTDKTSPEMAVKELTMQENYVRIGWIVNLIIW